MDKTLVSGRMSSYQIDKLDMLAMKNDRARTYMVEQAIKEYVESYEKESGSIIVDPQKLEVFRFRKKPKKIAS